MKIDLIKSKVRNVQVRDGKLPIGAFGSYLKLNGKLGLKIFKNNVSKTKKECLESFAFIHASEEFKILKKVSKSGVTPKAYKLLILKIKNLWYPCILMDDVGDSLVQLKRRGLIDDELTREYKNAARHLQYVVSTLGVIHKDVAPRNVCLKNGQFYLIDFSSDLVEFGNEKNLLKFLRF